MEEGILIESVARTSAVLAGNKRMPSMEFRGGDAGEGRVRVEDSCGPPTMYSRKTGIAPVGIGIWVARSIRQAVSRGDTRRALWYAYPESLRMRHFSAGPPVVVGIPLDANSSYMRGAAGAPAAIRIALHSGSGNSWTESGVDLGVDGVFQDAGDLGFTADAFTTIEGRVGELMDRGLRPISLGGDHSITLPVVRAVAKRIPELTIVHFDAHPDLYDQLEGNRMSHACPFARIMEERRAKRLIQVGIRTLTGHQREQARRFGVEVVEMRHLPALDRMTVAGPVYVSFDMDVLDPAFAPGVSHREPGGMSVREALTHLNAIGGNIVAADLVEFNPAQDISNMTATVAAKLLKEMLGKMISEGSVQQRIAGVGD